MIELPEDPVPVPQAASIAADMAATAAMDTEDASLRRAPEPSAPVPGAAEAPVLDRRASTHSSTAHSSRFLGNPNLDILGQPKKLSRPVLRGCDSAKSIEERSASSIEERVRRASRSVCVRAIEEAHLGHWIFNLRNIGCM